MTQYKGKPLKDMNREELIECLQHYSKLYTEAREAQVKHLSNSRRMDYVVF